MNTPNRRRILDRIGAWVARNVAEAGRPDHPARPGHVDPLAEATRQMQIDEAVRANRAMCESVRHHDSMSYLCTLHPGHTGAHECRDGANRVQHAWLLDADEAFDSLPEDIVGVPFTERGQQEIRATAESIQNMNEEDWEIALDELLPADVEGDER